jgi:DNA-binding transcriptional LysR family regulator
VSPHSWWSGRLPQRIVVVRLPDGVDVSGRVPMRCVDLDIITLKSLVAVVDLNGFRKAANYLNISQPALSRRIARLEEEFGIKLFERSGNQLKITSAGTEILQTARRIISEIDNTLSSIRDGQSSEADSMSISCISSLAFSILPRVVATYKSRFRQSHIAIQDRTTPLGLAAVRDGSVDFAIVIYHENPNENGLRYEFICEDEYLVICSRCHPLANSGAIRLRELRNHDLVMLDTTTTNYRIISQSFAKHSIEINPSYEVTHVATAIEFVANNVGIGLVPKSCMTNNDDVVALPLADVRLKRSIVVASSRDKVFTSRERAFLDILREALAARSVASA